MVKKIDFDFLGVKRATMERLTIPIEDSTEVRHFTSYDSRRGDYKSYLDTDMKTIFSKERLIHQPHLATINLYHIANKLEDKIITQDKQLNKVIEKLDRKDLQLKIAEWTISRLAKEKKEMEDKYEDIFDNLYKRLQYLEANIVSNLDELD